jgi:aspartate ammonia-lyase
MTRQEEDLLGTLAVPESAYWGIHTERARRNFPLTGRKVHPDLIRALALVKKACAAANSELGYLEEAKAQAIMAACDEIAAGGLADQFPVDALQGGAGTSTNMNVNEVIASRASERLGGQRGNDGLVHPLEVVNLHQSTNDVYPTALKIAAIRALRAVSAAVADLQGACQGQEQAFAGIVKIGRTELQEAVPMTLGAEFAAFAEAFARDRWRAYKAEERLRVVNLGGTAIGTGLTAPRAYVFLVIEKLREVTGLGLSRGENLPGETAHADVFVEASGILKALAVDLVKVAGDLRLLNLLSEVRLPALQAGSSLMPGKVNPVIPEAVIQAGLKAMAADGLIATAASRGSLQINEFLPLIADAFLEETDLLKAAASLLARQIRDLTADADRCRSCFDQSQTLVTAFVPVVGYEQAQALLREYRQQTAPAAGATGSAAEGKAASSLRAFLEEKLGKGLVDKVLAPQKLISLGYRDHEYDP